MIRNENPDLIHVWDEYPHSWITYATRLAASDTLVSTSNKIGTVKKWSGRWVPFQNIVDDGDWNWFPEVRSNVNIAASKLELVNRLGLPSSAKLIGIIGAQLPTKIMKNFIWAIELLQRIDDRVFLLVFGASIDRWRARRFRSQCQVADRVRFLPHDSPAWWLETLDIFWSNTPCSWLQSALSHEIPVVASTSIGRLLVDGKNCLVASELDRADFAKKSLQILQRPELAARLGKAGKESIGEFRKDDAGIWKYVRIYDLLEVNIRRSRGPRVAPRSAR